MSQILGTLDLMTVGVSMAGLTLLAGVVAAVVAVGYRMYALDSVPPGLSTLAALASIAVYLNTTAALGQVIGGRTGLLDLDAALVNVSIFALGAGAAIVGRRVGDLMAREIGAMSAGRELDTDLRRLVRTVGHVTAVALPEAERIEDLEGYDPVPAATKEVLGGKTLLFPARLTVGALHDRLVTRLKDDYAVGHVSLDLDPEGTVEHLAVGSRASGIGPTLPPGTGATAIRADPPFSASAGDVVQLWTTEGPPERVTTAELRAKAGDVVTISLDETEAESLDTERPYRLVTMPGTPRAEQEFAGLLRAADETLGVVTVEDGSWLVDRRVDDLDVVAIAIRPTDGPVEAIPSRSREFRSGDTVYAIGRPEALRRLETQAEAAEAEPSL